MQAVTREELEAFARAGAFPERTQAQLQHFVCPTRVQQGAQLLVSWRTQGCDAIELRLGAPIARVQRFAAQGQAVFNADLPGICMLEIALLRNGNEVGTETREIMIDAVPVWLAINQEKVSGLHGQVRTIRWATKGLIDLKVFRASSAEAIDLPHSGALDISIAQHSDVLNFVGLTTNGRQLRRLVTVQTISPTKPMHPSAHILSRALQSVYQPINNGIQ